jgi:hypothetical protein
MYIHARLLFSSAPRAESWLAGEQKKNLISFTRGTVMHALLLLLGEEIIKSLLLQWRREIQFSHGAPGKD